MSDSLIGLAVAGIIISLFMILKKKNEQFCNTEECRVNMNVIDHLKNVLKSIAPDAPNYTIYPGNESVTVNKEHIYICLRDPTNGSIYSFDILLYVTLHELAHVFSKTYSTKSHNSEFKTNFEKLLKRAYEKNLLPENISIPNNYCKKVENFFQWLF
jgi:hypothetical protein